MRTKSTTPAFAIACAAALVCAGVARAVAAAPSAGDCLARWQRARDLQAAQAYLQGRRAPGVIAPDSAAAVSAAATATVSAVRVRAGDVVVAGQVLLELQSDELLRDEALAARDIDMAQQDVVRLRERARSVAANLQRHRSHPDLFSKNEIDGLEADRVGADAEVRQAAARLQQAGIRRASLARMRAALIVRAPQAGVVLDLVAMPGQRVNAGDLLARVNGATGKRLRFALPASVSATLAAHASVCVIVPDRPWAAAVDLDNARRIALDAGETVAIDADVGAASRWPAGLSVEVLP